MPKKNKKFEQQVKYLKSMVKDYPIQAIEFYGHEAFPKIEGDPTVTFLQPDEQEPVIEHHTKYDIPILLHWTADNTKTIVLISFVPDNHANVDKVRLANYCMKLAIQHKTSHVVPVVVIM